MARWTIASRGKASAREFNERLHREFPGVPGEQRVAMSGADDLVKLLRNCAHELDASETLYVVRLSQSLAAKKAMFEAADMIEQMAQRIEADDAAYKELERRHAD